MTMALIFATVLVFAWFLPDLAPEGWEDEAAGFHYGKPGDLL